MCVTWLQFGVHLDRFGPNFSPTWPLGANLGPHLGQVLKTSFFTAISIYFQRFLALMGSCEAMLPTLGVPWAQLRRQMPPHMTKFKRAQVAPYCTPVGVKFGPEFGASCAQVGPRWAPVWPNLRPRTAMFDPTRLLVGLSRPASFLSVLFPSIPWRFSSRSDSNTAQISQIKHIAKKK